MMCARDMVVSSVVSPAHDRALILSAPEHAGEGVCHAADTTVDNPADTRLGMESVGIGEEDAEHRRGVQTIEVLGRQEVAQPVVDIRVSLGHDTDVAGSVVGSTFEHGGEELGLGAEVLKDHRLGHADTRGDVRHPRLLVPDGREQRDRRVEN